MGNAKGALVKTYGLRDIIGPIMVKTARSGCSPKSFRAMEARAKAPAVCELDGPTMMGPIMSLRP